MKKLDQISIYPIKSCGSIQPVSAEVLDRGFKLDRRWLLIDESGIFISQRNTPELSQISLQLEGKDLVVRHQNADSMVLPLNVSTQTLQKATIWNDTVEGVHLGVSYDQWFSEILGKKVQLIFMSDDVHRPLNKNRLPQDRSFEVSFADGYPYLLTSQSSLDDLNHRLTQPVPMERFRANLVVSGFTAFAEDGWEKIRIGSVEFLVVKPCARCQITTIDQKTGSASKEPLKTLATYRKKDGQVLFGMNLVALGSGTVHQDDTVTIIS